MQNKGDFNWQEKNKNSNDPNWDVMLTRIKKRGKRVDITRKGVKAFLGVVIVFAGLWQVWFSNTSPYSVNRNKHMASFKKERVMDLKEDKVMSASMNPNEVTEIREVDLDMTYTNEPVVYDEDMGMMVSYTQNDN